MGPAGEVLTTKHSRPAVDLLSAVSSQDNLCQNQGTRLSRCNPKPCPSASDARLWRSKASHINSSFTCSFADPTSPQPTLGRGLTTFEAASYPTHVRCGRRFGQHLFQWLFTACSPLCARVLSPKTTLPSCLSLHVFVPRHRSSSKCNRFKKQLY